MEFDDFLKKELYKGDFKSEAEDEYVKKLEASSKRDLLLRVGMGTFYFLLLIISLFIV